MAVAGTVAGAHTVVGLVDRKLSVDMLKIAMAIFVVAIHSNPLAGFGSTVIMLSGEGLFRFAVPVFFVANGYFFDQGTKNGGTARYIKRLLVLYLIWTALYFPGWAPVLDRPGIWPLLSVLMLGYWHLWYLPGLVMAVALAALVRDWPLSRVVAAMTVCYLAGVAIVYAMAFGALPQSRINFGDALVLHRNGVFVGFPFVMAGVLIHRYRLADRFGLPVLAGLTGVGLMLVLGESAALVAIAPYGVNHDNMLTLGLASPMLFLLTLKFTRQTPSRTLGTYANGMFFIHVAFCIIGFRILDLSRAEVFAFAVTGSVVVTWVLIRTGLSRRLL